MISSVTSYSVLYVCSDTVWYQNAEKLPLMGIPVQELTPFLNTAPLSYLIQNLVNGED